MIKEILKTILAGILVGIALSIMPFFLIKILAIILLFKLSFRLMGFKHGGHFHHKFHNMSDEEKEAYRKKFEGKNCCYSEKTETK